MSGTVVDILKTGISQWKKSDSISYLNISYNGERRPEKVNHFTYL